MTKNLKHENSVRTYVSPRARVRITQLEPMMASNNASDSLTDMDITDIYDETFNPLH